MYASWKKDVPFMTSVFLPDVRWKSTLQLEVGFVPVEAFAVLLVLRHVQHAVRRQDLLRLVRYVVTPVAPALVPEIAEVQPVLVDVHEQSLVVGYLLHRVVSAFIQYQGDVKLSSR